MHPVNWFPPRYIVHSHLRLRNSDGISPLKSFSARFRDLSPLRLANSGGNSPLKLFPFSPNPPVDTDRRHEDKGKVGEGVTGAMIRARTRVDGRLAGGLQALLGAPMAAYSGCGERDGGIGHGESRSRTGLVRVGGAFG